MSQGILVGISLVGRLGVYQTLPDFIGNSENPLLGMQVSYVVGNLVL